jgi:hypothetical protein
MSSNRSLRTALAGAVSLSLLAVLLAMPAGVLAKPPNWEITDVTELPVKVAAGENAGFSVTVRNNGPSNISKLFVFTAEGTPNPVFADASQGTCTNPDGALFCKLGALRKGKTATIVAAFPTPDDGSTEFSVDFIFNTSGIGSGGGDNSHGDELVATGTTELTDDPNFAGGFSTTAGDSAATRAINPDDDNLVSTKLTAPGGANNLILTVADEAGISNDPACEDCVDLPTSEMHLGNGSNQYGISKTVIEYDSSLFETDDYYEYASYWYEEEYEDEIDFSELTVLHIHDDLTSHDIAFQESCDGSEECATFEILEDGTRVVTIYLAQNGWVKYH